MISRVRAGYAFLGLTAAAVLLLTSVSNLRAQSAAQPPASMAGKTAGDYYKNVKVLKDIPAGDLLPTMEYITVAVGMQCGNCHDPRHFDNDDKRDKKSARNMMQLTFALDDTLFNGHRQITCYTCHRGSNAAAVNPELPGETTPRERTARQPIPNVLIPNLTVDSTMGPAPPGPRTAPPPANPANARPQPVLPSVDEVLAKYAQALGGEAAIGKVSSLSEKGSVEMLIPNPPGVTTPPVMGEPAAEAYRKAPDKAVTIIRLPVGVMQQGYDGAVGWHQYPAYEGEDTGGTLAVLKRSSELLPGLHAKDSYTGLVVDAIEKIGDRDAYRVIGQRPNGVDRLYFDAQSGLLVRLWTTMDTPLGSAPEEMNFEDYRDVSGVKIPFTVRVASLEGDRTYRWTQVVVNAPVEDSVFAQPAPRPPAAPPAAPANP
jgi:hypothetical protein